MPWRADREPHLLGDPRWACGEIKLIVARVNVASRFLEVAEAPPTSRLSVFLQPDRAGGVLAEQGALADVAAKHRRALVTGLLGNDTLWDTSRSSRGRKTGA